MLLVTGRILSELRADFPDVDEHVDVIVAENGAVVSRDGEVRLLAPSVDPLLAQALQRRGVDVRSGDVLLAGDSRHAVEVMEEIRALGLDAQIVHNKGQLMVLPAGVTKGIGLFEALGDLGVSHHSAIGVGDAENDHSLLDVCEVGVAVGGAVPALLRHADLVLDGRNGDGVVQLLDGPVLSGARPVHSQRWQLRLGSGPDGSPVTLPASQLKVLVCGDPGRGKSYVAGLMAERLTALGYCVLVVDPEGDHRELARLRGVVAVDARDGLPDPQRVAALLRQRFSSLVVDLSSLDPDPRQEYLSRLGAVVARQREDVGLPHWVILDEAQDAPVGSGLRDLAGAGAHGVCLVTYRVAELDQDTVVHLDAVLALAGSGPLPADVAAAVCRVSGISDAQARHLAGGLREHQALLAVRPGIAATTTTVTLAVRTTPQVRHEHKYGSGRLAPERWFFFRDGDDHVVAVAANMAELRAVLRDADGSVLRHHAATADLSRWVADRLPGPRAGRHPDRVRAPAGRRRDRRVDRTAADGCRRHQQVPALTRPIGRSAGRSDRGTRTSYDRAGRGRPDPGRPRGLAVPRPRRRAEPGPPGDRSAR